MTIVGKGSGIPPLKGVVVTVVVVANWIVCAGTGGHSLAVNPFAPDAGSATQDCVRLGPVVTWAQVVSTKLLPAPAAAGVQVSTGVGPVLALLQVVVVNVLMLDAGCEVQAATGVGGVVTVLQLVAVKVLVASAGIGVQDALGVGPVVIGAGQVIVTHPLPLAAVCGAQPTTGRFT